MAKNMYGGDQYPSIDTHSDIQMELAGLRPPRINIDITVFIKTKEERLKLKKLKCEKPGYTEA